MATYIPLFLKSRIARRKTNGLKKIIDEKSIIITKQKNVILLETKDNAEWFNTHTFDDFVKKQKALYFLTTNNIMSKLVNILVEKNSFKIMNMDYSKLENFYVQEILDEEGTIDWNNFVDLVEEGGDFKSITFTNNEFTFSVSNSGTLYLPEWVAGFEEITDIIRSLVVKDGN